MKDAIYSRLADVARELGFDPALIRLDYPEDASHGDFSTNIALAGAKKLGMPPRALADKIASSFKEKMPECVADISIAGPGFINFRLKELAVARTILDIVNDGSIYGRSIDDVGKKIMVEYTDPNPFKEFHIGHLMSNAIGESISRLVQSRGATVIRANWQGDVGPHVAKAVWAAEKKGGERRAGQSALAFWGEAYAEGSRAYDADPAAKAEIDALNKKIYDRSDAAVNELYDEGRADSLAAFDAMYARLGTKFDNYFFEGKEGRNGEPIVREFLDKGIFAESEGAIVFKGEQYGLHTRVFITSKGLPTYETKELGLNKEKFKLYPDLAESVIITGNEQTDYFRVLLKVFSLIAPHIAEKTRHMSHGLMRFASGKMSSRKGNVITAEHLISEIKSLVLEKIQGREFTAEEKDTIADEIAIGAIKYTILRQSIGGDVVFDSAASISFEGDSGPYLQYAAVRAGSILEKARVEGVAVAQDASAVVADSSFKASHVEKLLTRFPDIMARARAEYAPQHVAGYLIALAGAFNSYYASQTIIDKADSLSPYRLAIVRAFRSVMDNGLWSLGIKVPRRM